MACQSGRDDIEAKTSSSTKPARENLSDQRSYFIVIHTVGVFFLWLLAAIAESGFYNFMQTQAGLESIFPKQTILTIHRDCEDLRCEIYRWFTYQFTHINFYHVTINSICNLMIGIPLSWFQGSLRMACIFYVGVFGGAMGFSLSNGHGTGLVGMSAGVYSLLGFQSADLFINWSETKLRFWVLFSLILILIVEAANVQFNEADEQGAMSHSAHIGGAMAGILLGLSISRDIVRQPDGHDFWARTVSFGIGVFCTTFCIAWITRWPPRTLWDPTPWCWARQVQNATLFENNNWHCIRCQNDDCILKWSQQEKLHDVNAAICDIVVGWSITEG